ncbi:hypothetical protein OAL43_02000 [bacterium]|nr:hypothetical protein [bacterium]
MQERLQKIRFTTPPTQNFSTGLPARSARRTASTDNKADSNRIIAPLFVHSLPWHRIEREQANHIAVALGEIGVMVSALRSEIANSDGYSAFHDAQSEPVNQPATETNQDVSSLPPLPLIVPYRPERYGLSIKDFASASVIDVRLTMHRDETGRFAYSAEQLARWDLSDSGHLISGGSWVPSSIFPPDVQGSGELKSKFSQLRALAPKASIFVTLDPFHLRDDLPGVLANKPDGLIIRLDTITSEGIELATFVQKTRQMLDKYHGEEISLWIKPGDISPDDAAKLIALGASGIAIDSWLNQAWETIATASMKSGSFSSRATYANNAGMLADAMQDSIDRVFGLLDSLEKLPEDRRLTSLDQKWCDELGLTSPSLP